MIFRIDDESVCYWIVDNLNRDFGYKVIGQLIVRVNVIFIHNHEYYYYVYMWKCVCRNWLWSEFEARGPLTLFKPTYLLQPLFHVRKKKEDVVVMLLLLLLVLVGLGTRFPTKFQRFMRYLIPLLYCTLYCIF